jgi:hypothetical protein
MELHERALERQRRVGVIIEMLQLMDRWWDAGATPVVVGSAAFGLMVRPDLDLEITCPMPSIETGFAIAAELAHHPRVAKVAFANELTGPARRLAWRLGYRWVDEELWSVDMWLIAENRSGPCAADLVEPMRRALTEETRTTILELKEAIFDQAAEVSSIDVYRAVLDGGVRSVAELREWLPENESFGLVYWQPGRSS